MAKPISCTLTTFNSWGIYTSIQDYPSIRQSLIKGKQLVKNGVDRVLIVTDESLKQRHINLYNMKK